MNEYTKLEVDNVALLEMSICLDEMSKRSEAFGEMRERISDELFEIWQFKKQHPEDDRTYIVES